MSRGSFAAELVAATIRADVRAEQAYLVANAHGLIKLDAMENPHALPAELMRELGIELARVALNRYPDAKGSVLRQLLAKRCGLDASQDVLLGNGSDELISIMIQACARDGACVLSLGPGFVMYRLAAQFARVRFVEVPLAPDFAMNLAATLAAIGRDKPSLIFIAYPNNPTGTLFSRADVEAVIERSSGLVVIDEAYEAFSPDSFLGALRHSPRVLLLRTLSKVGLAGIRLGYLIGARELIAEFDKVRPPYNINSLTQCAARFALEHEDVLQQQADSLIEQRLHLLARLRQRDGLDVFDSKANFILFRLRSDDEAAAARVFSAIKAQGVLIKNVSSAHPLLRNCLRVTVSTASENQAFLDALDQAWPMPQSA